MAEQPGLSLTWSETRRQVFSWRGSSDGMLCKLPHVIAAQPKAFTLQNWSAQDTHPCFNMSHDTTKRVFGSLRPMPDTNRPAQPQKLARVLKFQLKNLEILYYLSSEQQRRWSDCADAQADLRLCCSHMASDTFSHGPAHITFCLFFLKPSGGSPICTNTVLA